MTPKTQARQNLIEAIRKVQTALVDAGHFEHWQIKARDKREPGREEKEAAEKKMERQLYRMFQYQQALVEQWLQYLYWDRKSVKEMPILPELAFDDDDIAQLIKLMQDAALGGVNLFGTGKPDIDYTLTNKDASRWAQKYTYELIKDLNNTTLDVLRSVIRQFVETPGMTIGDVVRQLPYDRTRALRIAVTEITRAYAEGEIRAGQQLAKEYPGVKVIKIWFTNADDIVCDICRPLDGKEAPIDGLFPNGQDKPPAHPNCRCWIETSTALAEL